MLKAISSSGSAGRVSRRYFLRYSSLAVGAAAVTGPFFLRGQNLNNKLNIGVIGAGGKGSSDTDSCASENIVTLCDVDQKALTERGAKYPQAKLYRDYRKMLDEMGKSIDAVIVATPDHIHAPAAARAMLMGKHAYVQKPLTHSVYEARTLRDLAKKKKVATQMGNQGSAGDGLRRAVEVIQAGVIGPVRQLHVWSNRPIWPQGHDRPAGELPVPGNLDWDLWLGPAPMRRYHNGYHPFAWRGWQDFGTGALGDMACHTVNMPFRALKLGYPTSIEARSTGINKETYPRSSEIKFEFPKREGLVPVTFTWYDGDPKGKDTFRPHADLITDIVAMRDGLPGSGCLLIGDKGRIFSPDDYGSQFYIRMNDERELVGSKQHEALKAIPENFVKSPGHYKEWLDACKGGQPGYSNFDIAAYLTEIILLGCVALRVGKKLDWDGPKMRAKNAPEAAQYVRRQYRKGWSW
ncbi:MAG: Gfo/Idh/MocA family oxidoreductase [Verrucomicrobia bacterium]|nr:Gfo/Idh/MocA family oxidoreductase [Verrucomicrobiota bacterium]